MSARKAEEELSMFTLVIGGSASGKSEYAERHVLTLEGPRVYIATMEPWDEECLARIARHRWARADRGFATVECYRQLERASVPEGANVLLEDLGNLTANELYPAEDGESLREAAPMTASGSGERTGSGDCATGNGGGKMPASERILRGVDCLLERCRHLTIVTNEAFSGGAEVGEGTLDWLRELAVLNRELARRADLVIEVVCGLPNVLKKEGTALYENGPEPGRN